MTGKLFNLWQVQQQITILNTEIFKDTVNYLFGSSRVSLSFSKIRPGIFGDFTYDPFNDFIEV